MTTNIEDARRLVAAAPQTVTSIALATNKSANEVEQALETLVNEGSVVVEDGEPPVVFDPNTPGWRTGKEPRLIEELHAACIKANANGLHARVEARGNEVLVWGVPPGDQFETVLDEAFERAMSAP